MTAPQPIPFTPEGPQPLLRETPPGAPYPVEALGVLRAAVEAVQGRTQAPVALPAQSALTVASLVVQGFADVEGPGGDARPLSLYALTVARSGERKSTCDAPFLAPILDHEREAQPEHRDAQRRHDDDVTLWKSDRDRIIAEAKKAKTKEAKTSARADLDALGAQPNGPRAPERIVTEPTFEGLTRLYVEGMPALGLFSDEGGQFLGGHAMAAENRTKSLAAFNKLWGGDPIRRTRAGDGSQYLHGRRLAAHLMVQPSVAAEFMSDPKTTDTGFLPRFLLCQPPSAIGTRLSHLARNEPLAVTAFQARASAILGQDMPIEDASGGLTPRRLPLSEDARRALRGYSDAVEVAQGPGGDLSSVTGWASKSPEQAARIAGVLTLWADLDAAEVSGAVMADAIQLAQFYLGEAVRLADEAMVTAETAKAEALRVWLQGECPFDAITVTDVIQRGPNALREARKAKPAINMLVEAGWLVPLREGTEVRGRARKAAWRIVKGGGHVV
ncbi:MAG: YfjI family protein [Hasllibacter sp.]